MKYGKIIKCDSVKIKKEKNKKTKNNYPEIIHKKNPK